MNGKQLKNSILQWAIQGKLVPQDSNDEPASVLLEKIRAEKVRLVKEGKLKKKDLEVKPISEDEIPFEILKGWEWVRLGEISTYSHTKKKVNASKANPHIWGLDLEDIEKGGKLLCIKTVEERKAIGDKTCFNRGDILYSKLRPYLLKILIAPKDGICTPEIIPFTCYGDISSNFIVDVLKSAYVDDYINSVTYGVKMPRVSTDTMTSLLVPLPPLAEQHRIVAKIEELMPLVEKYGAAQDALDEWNKALPEKLKKSILQEAIQGKLVPQDPADEPASALLERIREEKKRLVKGKQIILSKPEKKCKDTEEEDLDLPESWSWCLINDVCRTFGRIGYRGYTQEDLRKTKDDGAITLSPINIINGQLDITNCTYLSWEKYNESPEIQVKIGDIVLVKTASIGKCAIVKDLTHEMTINPQFVVIKDIKIDPDYLYYTLQSPYAQNKFQNYAIGTSIPTFSQVNLISMKIPLPPLAEQYRIVAKIEELFGVITK